MPLPSRTWPTLAAFLLSSAVAHAQATGVDTIYHLHGTVINAITGKPLARALVTSADRRLATMTGSEGQFAIDVSVPARPQNSVGPLAGTISIGSLSRRSFGSLLTLTAQKPGYIAVIRPAMLPLDETLSNTSVEIKLMPAAVITGHISSTTTDSAANVRVMLMQHQVNDGERIWQATGSQQTNGRGEFRFSNLRPGEYTLVTAEWQGDQQGPRSRTEITEQYPPVFYGDAHSLGTATKFHLHYGDTLATEFHLHEVPYYPVVIPVTGSTGGVSARLDTFDGFQLGYNGRDTAMEGSLPSGDYNLTLSSRGPNQQQSFASIPLHVAGAPVHTAPVALASPSPIEVHVHTQFSKPENSSSPTMSIRTNRNRSTGDSSQTIQISAPAVGVVLRSEDNRGAFPSTRPDAAGDLTIENVPPGRYFVNFQPFRGYVASATRGGIDLTQHELVVGPSGGGEPIEITLRDDTATLSGTVNYGSKPAQQCFVMLLPLDASARFMQAFAGPDGKFTASNVPPGSYRVLAFPTDGTFPQIAWRDAEAMHRYEHKGSTVSLAAGQNQTVDVRAPDDADALDP